MSRLRAEKVSNLLQKKINDILQKEVDEPELGFLTITRVRVSKDLKYAKIFFSVLGESGQKEKTISILKRLTPFFRYRIGQGIRLKYTPEIHFLYDEQVQKAQRIEELIDIIHKKDEG